MPNLTPDEDAIAAELDEAAKKIADDRGLIRAQYIKDVPDVLTAYVLKKLLFTQHETLTFDNGIVKYSLVLNNSSLLSVEASDVVILLDVLKGMVQAAGGWSACKLLTGTDPNEVWARAACGVPRKGQEQRSRGSEAGWQWAAASVWSEDAGVFAVTGAGCKWFALQRSRGESCGKGGPGISSALPSRS